MQYPRGRGGARHFHLGGPLEGPGLQQGELSMVCVGLSERDLKIFGGTTGGARFATRGAVNGLCRTFRKRPENFWGDQAKFWGAVAPLAPP